MKPNDVNFPINELNKPINLKASFEDALSFIGKCFFFKFLNFSFCDLMEKMCIFLGFGKIQIIMTICCGFVIMEIVSETMMMSIIMPAAQCDLKLTSSDKGILSASPILGKILLY